VSAELTDLLAGPSAIAFVQGDVVEAAKGLRDFSRANPFLVIKGGVLDGKVMSPDEIAKLADLEPREVLLAKLAGAMKASMANAAATFAALPVQMARLLAALEAKQAEQAGGAESQSAADGADSAEAADGADSAEAADGAGSAEGAHSAEGAAEQGAAEAGDSSEDQEG
jgi:large subunit ribosomal protein L10